MNTSSKPFYWLGGTPLLEVDNQLIGWIDQPPIHAKDLRNILEVCYVQNLETSIKILEDQLITIVEVETILQRIMK